MQLENVSSASHPYTWPWGSPENPALVCADRVRCNPSNQSGDYWIKPSSATQSFQLFCNMVAIRDNQTVGEVALHQPKLLQGYLSTGTNKHLRKLLDKDIFISSTSLYILRWSSQHVWSKSYALSPFGYKYIVYIPIYPMASNLTRYQINGNVMCGRHADSVTNGVLCDIVLLRIVHVYGCMSLKVAPNQVVAIFTYGIGLYVLLSQAVFLMTSVNNLMVNILLSL